MATTSANILVGPATFSIGAYVANAAASAFTDVGHTKGPTTYAPNFTDYEVKSEQAYGVIKKVPIEANMTVKVQMLECTLEWLRTAMRQPTAQLNAGVLAVDIPREEYRTLKLVSPAPSSATRTILFWKDIVTEVAEINVAKADTQAYNITFTCLFDDTVTNTTGNGRFFKVTDA